MPEPPRLRRRPFGYKRDRRRRGAGCRDAQLAELRQDIAALWLAFAQHDRMIRELTGGSDPGSDGASEPEPTACRSPRSRLRRAGDAESVGRQLSDLDDVLAAIEMATQTLERTYSDEVAEPDQPAGNEAAGSPPRRPPEQGGRTASP